MKKYQDILRDVTSRNLAAKKVNTSLLMLPLRLETKIMYRRVDKTDEPEKVLYAFKSLHSLLQSYHRLAGAVDKGEIEVATRNLKQQMRETIHCFETIDLLYAEDKSYLNDLVTNIHNSLHTVELQDAFAPLIDTLDDIPRLTSHSDKGATNYLNELDRITRMLENMVNCPLFTGRRRDGQFATYSQTARFRYAYKRYKEINSWFQPTGKGRKITALANSIHSGMITKSQCIRFDNLIKRIKKAITFAPLSDDNHGGLRQAHSNLTKGYPYEHNINPEDNLYAYGVRFVMDEGYEKALEEFHVSLYPNNPVAGRNKYFHYNRMVKMAGLLYDNLTSFINNDFEGVKTSLNAKTCKPKGRKKPCSIRYTLIVSKLLRVELLLAKAAHAKNRRMRRPYLKAAYKCQSSLLSSLNEKIYFTYGAQRSFVKDLLNDIISIDNNARRHYTQTALPDLGMCFNIRRKVPLKKAKKRKCLCLRIYPDVVALTQAVRQISREEYLAGKDFWLKYIFNDDEKYRQSLWLAICDLFPAHRSAFILKSTFPKGNYAVMCRKAREFHDNNMTIDDFIKEIDENFVNSFPTTYVDNGEQLFTVPVTNLLPDRFVVHAAVKTKVNASRTIIQYGHRLPKQLQVGLDLNNLDTATKELVIDSHGRKQLYLNGGLSWMTDYDEAERLGMAITIPLDAMKTGLKKTKVRNFEFNQIIVYGVNDSSTYESNKMIKDLMTGSLYSDKAMDIISFETATNIITNEDAKYAFDSSEEKQRERFQYQAYNCVNPHVPERGNDLDILDRLLCLNESVVGNIDVPGEPGQAEVELQRRVNSLMIEYITDSRLCPVINPLINAIKNSPTLHDYLCNDVLSRGPFPMMRIGDQPYGILPACDFRNLAVRASNPLAIVKKILLLLTIHWNNILSTNIVTCYGKDSDNSNTTVTTNDYLDILGNTPRSTSFYRRKMVQSGIIDAEYFRGETYHHQIEELMKIAKSLNLIKEEDRDQIKKIIPNYDFVPMKIKDPNAQDEAYFYIKDALGIDKIVNTLCETIEYDNKKYPNGIQLSASPDIIRNYVIEFFDLFNYRLDAWIMGILNNKIRTRMNCGRHRLALGCFGWLFNLREVDDYKLGSTNEYIVAPSINQAITGAILRSSYNNSLKNGKAHNYDMSVNLSSERVRSAIRIIEGIQNGLSLGCILGADMERLIHEAWKTKPELELDSCIYPLRIAYPLMKKDQDDAVDAADGSPANITVLNGARLLEDYTARKNAGKDAVIAWLKLFVGITKQNEKIEKLINIIDIIDDEKDALTDVVLSESVYKLTQGNTEASAAISRALKELKNIPMPEVTEIPISSAQIDNYMLAMLPASVKSIEQSNLLANIEPKVDAWLCKMMHRPDNIYMRPRIIKESAFSLGSLGISASEMVYLSADKTSFTHFVEVLAWMKTGTFRKMADCESGFALKGDDKHAFGECAMAIDELRKVLASARPLTNDDLVKQTGLSSSAVYSEMSDEYHHVEGYITRLLVDIKQLSDRQQEIQNPENADYEMVALPDDMVAEAVRILLDCYRIGYTMALDAVDQNVFIGQRNLIDGVVEWKETVQAQHALFKSMLMLYDNMQAKLAEAAQMIAADAERKYTTYVEALKTVLVSGYLVVPSFRPDENVPIADLADQAAEDRFDNINRMELEAMMGDLALVEQPMMNLHQLRLFQKCDDIDAPGIVPMQLASVENNIGVNQWLGTTVASEDEVRDAFTYIVMSPEYFVVASSEQEPLLAGIVIDHWIERIPYRDQTAAVAFGYDQPDAEAPQTLLLAVATKDNNKGWNEKMLVNSIKSAIHMVKCRTVSPDLLSKDGWASGLFPLLEYKDPRNSN